MQIEIKITPSYTLQFRNIESGDLRRAEALGAVCWHDVQQIAEKTLERICMDRGICFERTGFSVIVEIVRIARAPMCLATLLAAAPIAGR